MAETYRNAAARNVGTTPVALATGVNDGITIVRSILLAVPGSTTLTVNIDWTDASDSHTPTTIAAGLAVIPGVPFVVPGPIILEDGDSLRITASDSGIDATAALAEVT